jgi:hypothetical protein
MSRTVSPSHRPDSRACPSRPPTPGRPRALTSPPAGHGAAAIWALLDHTLRSAGVILDPDEPVAPRRAWHGRLLPDQRRHGVTMTNGLHAAVLTEGPGPQR